MQPQKGTHKMWYKIHDQEVTITIYAKPRAKRTALLKIDENGLHISLHAKPVEGEANHELINYLAKLFNLPKNQIILKKGEGSKHKIISVPYTQKIADFIKNAL
jgi:uncharacterized protein (TIGR00251 family)